MTVDNRREYYRIPFAPADRPRLVVGASICEVVDCSERGVRFLPAGVEAPGVGEEVEGRLRFPRGVELAVRGSVVRSDDARVALHLTGSGIPYSIIFQEQLHLRRRNH